MPANKALFLDRDGVINVERCYVHTRDAFQFQDGIFELCRAAQSLGYLLVVVTNQAGIARGYYTEAEFLELTDWMMQRFADQQIHLSRVYYCPHHPIHGVGKYKRDSPDRKPRPGLLLRACKDLDLDLSASILIGDNLSDLEAGRSAGVGKLILLRSQTEDLCLRDLPGEAAASLNEIRKMFFSHDQHYPY